MKPGEGADETTSYNALVILTGLFGSAHAVWADAKSDNDKVW
jgi:hypothetical protein